MPLYIKFRRYFIFNLLVSAGVVHGAVTRIDLSVLKMNNTSSLTKGSSENNAIKAFLHVYELSLVENGSA